MKRNFGGMTVLRLSIAGTVAGILNGLLGAGGGIVVVYTVSKFLPDVASDKNGAFSTALCVMLPISALSCAIYAFGGHMSLDGFGIFIIPAIVGGAVGGALLGKIRSLSLKKLFSALLVVSGVILMIR